MKSPNSANLSPALTPSQLRASEKRILLQTIEAVREEIKGVPALISDDDKVRGLSPYDRGSVLIAIVT